MTEQKNPLEEIRNIIIKLNPRQRQAIYDILTVVRGPDPYGFNYLKIEVTARVRSLLGFLGGSCYSTNTDPLRKYLEMMKFIDTPVDKKKSSDKILDALGHYKMHARDAVQALRTLGYFKESEEVE